jgi:hypothetical protein
MDDVVPVVAEISVGCAPIPCRLVRGFAKCAKTASKVAFVGAAGSRPDCPNAAIKTGPSFISEVVYSVSGDSKVTSSSRTRQNLNQQNQLHEPTHRTVGAETAAPSELPNREPVFVWDTNGSTTLQPSSLPDPIFGYPSVD